MGATENLWSKAFISLIFYNLQIGGQIVVCTFLVTHGVHENQSAGADGPRSMYPGTGALELAAWRLS